MGGAGNDYLIGSSIGNILSGGLGNDTLRGGVGADTLIGGAGSDWADFSDTTSGITVTLNSAGSATVSRADGSDVLIGIENIRGSTSVDNITGDSLANIIAGGNGNDSLAGGGGNDTLLGGLGNDTLVGGNGSDWADFSENATAVNLILGVGQASLGTERDNLVGIENILGTKVNDTLASADSLGNIIDGGNGNDWIRVMNADGNDTLIGGVGIDTLDLQGVSGAVTVNLTSSIANAASSNDLVSGFEFVRTDAGNDLLMGGSGNETLSSGAGSDTLSGGSGNDSLNGGAGFDWLDYSYTTNNMNIINTGSAISVTVSATDRDTAVSVEAVISGSGNDMYVGSASIDVYYGGLGNDSASVGVGTDTVMLGNGNDALIISSTYGVGQDSVDLDLLNGGSGFDSFLMSGSGVKLNLTTFNQGDANIENFERIDMGAASTTANSLTLATQDVLDFTDLTAAKAVLIIDGGVGDSIAGSGFSVNRVTTSGVNIGVDFNGDGDTSDIGESGITTSDGTLQLNGTSGQQTYYVYQSTAWGTLLVDTDINNSKLL